MEVNEENKMRREALRIHFNIIRAVCSVIDKYLSTHQVTRFLEAKEEKEVTGTVNEVEDFINRVEKSLKRLYRSLD